MNRKQLLKAGVPDECVPVAIECIQRMAQARAIPSSQRKKYLQRVLDAPERFENDDFFGPLAKAMTAAAAEGPVEPHGEIPFTQWGEDIDQVSRDQIANACRLPVAAAAALMPDAHTGYGLPIGGVLACDNAVVPYGVGVDIACRMRLTLTDLPIATLQENDPAKCRDLDEALKHGTRFGVGAEWRRPQEHPVMDEDWSITAVTREERDKAWRQLGTSGSGNHFVEWGLVELDEPVAGVPEGRYVALLSHSGSRGAGSAVCRRYTDIARRLLPHRYREDKSMVHLAWLSLDRQEGIEYWEAMNLMGRYAAANHEIIHRNVVKLSGGRALGHVENHHNFAWKEEHLGRTLVVHRKGATPAGAGDLGVIPGNMADPAFIVRGRGNEKSLCSASHGAGRRMSRTEAKRTYNWRMWTDYLKKKNVRLLAAGIDEVPGVYKDIHEVMQVQDELVDTLGMFYPRIVMMCGDNSPAED